MAFLVEKSEDSANKFCVLVNEGRQNSALGYIGRSGS